MNGPNVLSQFLSRVEKVHQSCFLGIIPRAVGLVALIKGESFSARLLFFVQTLGL
jgi:hypothetical protein